MVLEGINISWSELIGIIVAIPTAITIPLTAWLVKLKGKVDSVDERHNTQDLKIEKLEMQMSNYKTQFDTQLQKIDLAVTAIRENILESREVHRELRDDMKEIKTFTIDWNQRIEDRIQNLVNQLLSERGVDPASLSK